MTSLADTFNALPSAASAAAGVGFGAIAGSFLATVIDRWPRGERIGGLSRSQCDHCGRQLRWFELVPLISWLVLRGRCRTCGARIAPLHFAVEGCCALLGAAAFAAGAPLIAPFLWLLLTLALFDARLLWLPNPLVIASAIAALIAPPAEPELPLSLRILTGIAAWATLWLLAAAYRKWRGREGLGGGDPKLFGAIALWSGPAMLPTILLAACAIGIGDAVRRVARGADAASVALPFGTYLAAATILFAAIGAIARAGGS